MSRAIDMCKGLRRGLLEELYLHHSTVRYRLRRSGQHTRRSLWLAKDFADLCLAFDVHRRP